MRFEFDILGKKHAVTLEKSDEGYTAQTEDKTFVFTASRVDNEFIVLEVNRERYIVFIGENSGTYNILVRGEEYTVEKAASDVMRAEAFSEHKREGNIITAPMPGKVIKVLFNKGDAVSSGQTLAIIEAMKMENNIIAHRNAVIKSIAVKAGDQVNLSDTIIEFESGDNERS